MQISLVNCNQSISVIFRPVVILAFASSLSHWLYSLVRFVECGRDRKGGKTHGFQWFVVLFLCFSTFFWLFFAFLPPLLKSCKTTEKKQVTASVHARGRSPKISEFFMKNVKILVLNFRLFLAFLHEKSLGSEMHCVGELLQKSSIALSKSTPPQKKKIQ